MKKILLIFRSALLFCSLVVCSGFNLFVPKPVDVSEQHNWVIVTDPAQKKAQNEYDAIIVGGGIGGLSSAALLSKEGYKVLVLEQQSQVGGYCTSYSRNGFTFPVGAHDISGCDQGAVGMLLAALHLKKDDLFALHTRTYFFGDKKITFTGKNNDVVEKLSGLFPEEKDNIKSFFEEVKKAFDEHTHHRRDAHQPCPTYEAWKQATYQQKLDEYFQNTELKSFLCSLLDYIGTKPEETTASDTLSACFNYFIYGGYYPKRGGKLFADSLKNVIESQGGTVLTNTYVDEILVTDNHLTGVRTGSTSFASSIVIANANAKKVFLQLLPQKSLSPSFINAIRNLKMSTSLAIVNLGIDLDLSSLSSIVRKHPGAGSKVNFFISSNADPSTAPKSSASISIGIHAEYADVPPPETPAYKEYKDKLAEQALAKLEKVFPEIRKHIIVIDVVTPRTFESFTSMPEGASYSFDQAKGSKRPSFKTPIEGLYLASASTNPGGGVEAVVAAGMTCSRDILQNKKTQDSQKILLPPPSLKGTLSVEEVIKKRHSTRAFKDQPISLSDIAQLLWAAQGITHKDVLRAAPSAGALFPLEIYLVVRNVTGLPAGVYKYNVKEACLEKRIEGSQEKSLYNASYSQMSVQQAAANIVICAQYEKSAERYGKNNQQYVDMEAGCVAENVYLQAEALNLGTVFVAGFSPDAVSKILGAAETEHPVCLLPIGKI